MLLVVVLLLVVLSRGIATAATVVIVDREVFSGMVHLVALSPWRSVSQRLIFAMPSAAAELEAGKLPAFRPLPIVLLGRQG